MSAKRKVPDEPKSVDLSKKGHWSLGLKQAMTDPELKVEEDADVVIIKDKYPKAEHHYLVLPKEELSSLKVLRASHLPLLKHMDQRGRVIAERVAPGASFRFGYHAVASMSHLHLHVISQDFNSPWLKTKNHWNSFTSRFFVDSRQIISELEKTGKVTTMDSSEAKSLMETPLRCHVCAVQFTTMPKLKDHLLRHR